MDTNSTKNDDVVLPVGAGAGDNTSDAGIRASIRASRHALFAVLLGSTIVIYISASMCSDLNEIYEVLNAGRPGRSRHLRNLQSRSTSDVHAQVGAAMQTHASAHGLHGFGEECGKNFYVMWAVICSTVSAFVSLYLLLAGLVNGGANPIPLLGMSMKWPSGFLAIWWTFGTGTFTFDKPFAHVGNGFFASWLAFSASLVLAASHIPIVAQKFNDARTAVQAQYIALMCFVSGINLVASSVSCSNLCGALGAWAVACSAVSFLVSGACILTPGAPGSLGPVSSKHVAIFFAVWWSVGVFFQTFEGPFVSVTTGYLSAWLSFAVALRLNGFTPPPLVNENQ